MPLIQKSFLPRTALIAALALSSAAAFNSEAVINYGDYSDIPPGTITYTGVTESSGTNALPPALYGAPDINGDLLDFDPLAFTAQSAGAGGFDLTDGQLNFTMTAEPGEAINSLIVSEGGDYSFSGVTPDAGTFLSVSVATTINILAVDGDTLGLPIEIFQTDTFVIDYASVGNAPSTGLNLWSLDYTVDILGALNSPFQLGATEIEVVIDNQLTTTTTAGNQAFVSKKDFNVNVPEPTSLALIGLGGLLMVRRRRDR
ncbi:MAG: PEP-CTERM sorting domain-containing protein [Phycisphaeraceae bacterium]